ncbi:hypothetical protein D8Y22_06220 [Salinadaptatus halalkaliphilus]|uniref:DUF7260 domain-containing protein n=1 Tax=Salinadaptatus halalkaliphilus TaxID=2419781 RepID=A0A4S3TN81_9EURY|nr:hypothetical protein [Salinadaptatus halalkaliphilus]THE65759.1 hypothetical protein D8Y22_06220 [Salinadaptatus halalkaliphilus]
MTVETHVHGALSRVETERESVANKLDAVDRFAKRVDDLDPVSNAESIAPQPTNGGALAVSTTVRSPVTAGDQCEDVRDVFAETVRPHSVDDVDEAEPLQETIAAELGTELAVALAPTTDHQCTPDLQASILSAVQQNRSKLETMSHALKAERDSLRAALDALEPIIAWLVDANERSLLELNFEELQDRHETLSIHRETCRRCCQDRQAVLQDTTTYNGTGMAHHQLVSYLYGDPPTTYPVLSTALRLEACCRDCQRAVRDHLTRRV